MNELSVLFELKLLMILMNMMWCHRWLAIDLHAPLTWAQKWKLKLISTALET